MVSPVRNLLHRACTGIQGRCQGSLVPIRLALLRNIWSFDGQEMANLRQPEPRREGRGPGWSLEADSSCCRGSLYRNLARRGLIGRRKTRVRPWKSRDKRTWRRRECCPEGQARRLRSILWVYLRGVMIDLGEHAGRKQWGWQLGCRGLRMSGRLSVVWSD